MVLQKSWELEQTLFVNYFIVYFYFIFLLSLQKLEWRRTKLLSNSYLVEVTLTTDEGRGRKVNS